MAQHAGQGDPDVAVDVLLAGGPGRGVVVDAGALDAGAVALRRRVVQGEQPMLAGVQPTQHEAQQPASQEVGLASDGAQQIVIKAEVSADAGGAEPGGGGASAAGEEDADPQDGPAWGESRTVEAGGPGGQQGGQVRGQTPGSHLRLSCSGVRLC